MIVLFILGAIEWTETTTQDFLDNKGIDPMMYVTKRSQYESEAGCVEFYARFDVDNDRTYDLGAVSQVGTGVNGELFLYYGDANSQTIYSPTRRWTYGILTGGGGIDLADLNMDGYAELIHSGWKNRQIRIYWNDASLNPPHPNPNDYTSLSLPADLGDLETIYAYDLDNDTYLDIIGSSSIDNPALVVWWGASGGVHGVQYSNSNRSIFYGFGSDFNIEIADINKDGWGDIVCACQEAPHNLVIYWGMEGNPRNYKKIDTLYYPTIGHQGISVADLNNDGWLDVALTGCNQTRDSYIYFGYAEGFSNSPLILSPGDCYGGSIVWDWNSDNWPDIIFLRGRDYGSQTWGEKPLVYYNLKTQPYFSDDAAEEIGSTLINASGGFVGDLNCDSSWDIYINSNSNYSSSCILWGPYYNYKTNLPINQDHHAVSREPANIYDRTYSAWYFSSVFDCGEEFNVPKNALLDYIGFEPAGAIITFSMRSGLDSIPDDSWTDWKKVVNGCIDPYTLSYRYVQYRAEFHYSNPASLPWLEYVKITFSPVDFFLRLWPDTQSYISPDNYCDFRLFLSYNGDRDDSFNFDVRITNPGWRVQMWDTAYNDTIPGFIKLTTAQPNGTDTAFITRIYAPANVVIGERDTTIIYTKTNRCIKNMRDSVILITLVVAPGIYETRIEYPIININVPSLKSVGEIDLMLPSGEVAELIIYDARGRKIWNKKISGNNYVVWSNATTPSGVYFIYLKHPKGTILRKTILLH